MLALARPDAQRTTASLRSGADGDGSWRKVHVVALRTRAVTRTLPRRPAAWPGTPTPRPRPASGSPPRPPAARVQRRFPPRARRRRRPAPACNSLRPATPTLFVSPNEAAERTAAEPDERECPGGDREREEDASQVLREAEPV